VVIPGQGAGSKVKAHKTSGGRKMPVRHTIPLGIVIFLVFFGTPIISFVCIFSLIVPAIGLSNSEITFILMLYFLSANKSTKYFPPKSIFNQ